MYTLIFAITTILGLTTAAPAASSAANELIPGPGLPSLASLNLTLADLDAPLPKVHTAKLEARFDAFCGPNDGYYAHVDDMIKCYNYIKAAGNNPCTAPAGNKVVRFCALGTAVVTGQALNSGGTTSACRDVASAVLYTIDHCTRPDKTVAGYQAAGGNGNLIVGDTNPYHG